MIGLWRKEKRWIEITTAIGCTNNCTFCPQSTFTKSYFKKCGKLAPRLLSYNNFLKILKNIPKSVGIGFSGFCEPFQNPKCTEMVLVGLEKGFDISIYTTLMGLSQRNMERILEKFPIKSDSPKIIIHIPSVDKIESIRITPEYYKTLESLLSSGIQPVEFHYHGAKPVEKVKKMVEAAGYKVEFAGQMSRAGNLKGRQVPVINRRKGTFTCKIMNERGHVILPDGTVLLCCMDYGMKHILGNILKSSYSSFHTGGEWQKILQGTKDEKIDTICRYCDLAKGVETNIIKKLWSYL